MLDGEPIADVGVFGGSGFYEFLDGAREVHVASPFGEPASPLVVGELDGRRVAFLPRHGADHRFPPHRIPYRANVDVMRRAGVGAVFAPCASGSLQPHVAPGSFVVADQLVDRTKARGDTFWDLGAPDDPATPGHVPFADPYHPTLRRVAIDACRAEGVDVHETGTVVVIEGPRFSTRAESRWFSSQGWEVVNMTQHPEAPLAAEAGLPYATIALITDFDAGLEDDPAVPPVTQDEVFAFFRANLEAVRRVLFRAVAAVPQDLIDATRRARVA